MNKLKTYINNFISLEDSDWMEMMKLFKSYSYKKGEFIYGSSDIPAEVNFIVSGAYFPDIFKRVSQQHISSYLGITRQSLNRLRRERE